MSCANDTHTFSTRALQGGWTWCESACHLACWAAFSFLGQSMYAGSEWNHNECQQVVAVSDVKKFLSRGGMIICVSFLRFSLRSIFLFRYIFCSFYLWHILHMTNLLSIVTKSFEIQPMSPQVISYSLHILNLSTKLYLYFVCLLWYFITSILLSVLNIYEFHPSCLFSCLLEWNSVVITVWKVSITECH